MSFFEALVDNSFKRDDSGRTLYYPWGPLGRGFIVESEETIERVRNILKYIATIPFFCLFFLICLYVAPFFDVFISIDILISLLFITLFSTIFFVFWFYFFTKKITSPLQKSNEKLRVSETHGRFVRSCHLPTLVFIEIILIIVFAAGIFFTQSGLVKSWDDQFSIYFFIELGGLGALSVGYLIFAKIRQE